MITAQILWFHAMSRMDMRIMTVILIQDVPLTIWMNVMCVMEIILPVQIVQELRMVEL